MFFRRAETDAIDLERAPPSVRNTYALEQLEKSDKNLRTGVKVSEAGAVSHARTRRLRASSGACGIEHKTTPSVEPGEVSTFCQRLLGPAGQPLRDHEVLATVLDRSAPFLYVAAMILPTRVV